MSVIGLRVGPFEILEPASVPEEGAWYRARRSGLTRRQPAEVLLCLLPPDAPAEQRAVLQRRFDALKQLDDARIPEAVAFYEGTGALAVTAADGHPLVDLVDARRAEAIDLSPATVLDVGLEIAECMQRVHHRGRLHGHLSPDRVVLAPDGRVWIWGFGLGPLHAADPRWCPPERARGEPPSAATDQWSLGAILTGLATGLVPWAGDDPLAQARTADIDPLVEPVEREWPALGRALRRMLDPRPGNRFPSMNPVRQELLALARKAPGTSARRELAASLTRADLLETAPFAPDRAEEPEEAFVDAPAPSAAEPVAETGDQAEAPVETELVAEAVAEPDPTPGATPEPGGVAEPAVAFVRDTPDEPIRRGADPLPEEQIPVVRPKLRGDVPVARVSAPGEPAAPPPVPVPPVELEAPSVADDHEPPPAPDAEPPPGAQDEAEPQSPDPDGADAPSFPVDGGATPTLAPATDAEEDDEPPVDEPEGAAATDGFDDEAPLVALRPGTPSEPAEEAPPSLAVRAAPYLVGTMVLLMLVWLAVRVL